MPGICTSAITHDVPFKRPDRKKSSADENAWTEYPCDLRNLLVAARTDASSSTTEITETVDKTGLFTREPALVQHDRSVEKCAANQPFEIILRFGRSSLTLHGAHLMDHANTKLPGQPIVHETQALEPAGSWDQPWAAIDV